MFPTPTGLWLTPVLQFSQVQGHMEHFHFQVGHNASFSHLAKVSFLEGKRSCSHNKRWHHPEVEAWNIKQEMNNHLQLGPGEEYYKVKLVSCWEAVFLWINQGDKGERTSAHLWCWRQCWASCSASSSGAPPSFGSSHCPQPHLEVLRQHDHHVHRHPHLAQAHLLHHLLENPHMITSINIRLTSNSSPCLLPPLVASLTCALTSPTPSHPLACRRSGASLDNCGSKGMKIVRFSWILQFQALVRDI